MTAPLQAILDAELARGNRVLDSGEWPPLCDLFVLLARPFHKRYPLSKGLAYEVIGDPHCWKAEYRHGRECLACAF
ncbi:hypothetical protein [Bosea vestrisii]|uniref:Uncharacterized protein n=1 Tax=Bosea vestrisii TaxID=151416 RepID=A0ABW0HC39_9HYPH